MDDIITLPDGGAPLVAAIRDLINKIEALDISIDYLASAVTGQSAIEIGGEQSILGRVASPAFNNPSSLSESQLKQMIEEQLEGLVSEQSSVQQGQAASPAFQMRRDTISTTTDGKEEVIDTSMYRGKQDFSPKAQRQIKPYATKHAEEGPEGYKETTTSGFTSDSPDAAEKLEFQPWKRSETTTRDVAKPVSQFGEKEGTQSWWQSKINPQTTTKTTETEFIQPANTRYGQLDPTRQVTESQLKQMI